MTRSMLIQIFIFLFSTYYSVTVSFLKKKKKNNLKYTLEMIKTHRHNMSSLYKIKLFYDEHLFASW